MQQSTAAQPQPRASARRVHLPAIASSSDSFDCDSTDPSPSHSTAVLLTVRDSSVDPSPLSSSPPPPDTSEEESTGSTAFAATEHAKRRLSRSSSGRKLHNAQAGSMASMSPIRASGGNGSPFGGGVISRVRNFFRSRSDSSGSSALYAPVGLDELDSPSLHGRSGSQRVSFGPSSTAAPARRDLLLTLGLFGLVIFLTLDRFVIRRPFGLFSFHELFGGGIRSESVSVVSESGLVGPRCGWDYEASWAIGVAQGPSPLNFNLLDGGRRPALTCNDVTHVPASFVADPFLFLPSNAFPLHEASEGNAHLKQGVSSPSSKGSLPATPSPPSRLFQFPSRASCDLSRAEPVASSNTGYAAPHDKDSFPGIPGATDVCYSNTTHVRRGATIHPKNGVARFTAPTASDEDAAASMSAASAAAAGFESEESTRSDPWYLFSEVKHLGTRRGELGAHVSFNQGASWENLGTVLRETFHTVGAHGTERDPAAKEGAPSGEVVHLSYPQVMLARGRLPQGVPVEGNTVPVPSASASSSAPAGDATASSSSSNSDILQYVLIPETHGFQSVRVYTTDACCFPYGWRLHSTKLSGQKFVDSNPVFWGDRWYIFTTVEYSLRLYTTGSGPDRASLLDATWEEHPLSPLYTHDRRFGRSAGRVVPHWDGGLLRMAQDCSSFYGEQVHMMHITELTPDTFKETWVRSVKPQGAADHATSREGFLGRGDGGVLQSDFITKRLHHIDAHFIPAHAPPKGAVSLLSSDEITQLARQASLHGHSSGSVSVSGSDTESSHARPHALSGSPRASSSGLVPGRWVFALDGDDKPDDYWFWKREGWFNHLKTIVLLGISAGMIWFAARKRVLKYYIIAPAERIYARRQSFIHTAQIFLFEKLPAAYYRLVLGSSYTGGRTSSSTAPSGSQLVAALVWRYLVLCVALSLAVILALGLTSFYPFNMSCCGWAGAHSAYDSLTIPTTSTTSDSATLMGFSAMSYKSQAYANAHLWSQGALSGQIERVSGSVGAAATTTVLPSVSPLQVGVTPRESAEGVVIPLTEEESNLPSAEQRVLAQMQSLPTAADELGAGIYRDPVAHSPASSSFFTSASTTSSASGSNLRVPRLFILTSATSAQFSRVKNLLGSLHFWTASSRGGPIPRGSGGGSSSKGAPIPPYEVILYDHGLTPMQRAELACARYVRLVRLVYTSSSPVHTRIHSSGAALSLMLTEALQSRSAEFGILEGDAVLHLAAEMELRASPAEMTQRLFARGYFTTPAPAVADTLRRAGQYGAGRVSSLQGDWAAASETHAAAAKAHGQMLHYLHVDSLSSMAEKPLCSSDVIGFVKLEPKLSVLPSDGSTVGGRSPLQLFLPLVQSCTSNPACLVPGSSTPDNRDPSILFSLALHRAGIGCVLDESAAVYAFGDVGKLNPDPTLLTSLRIQLPKGANKPQKSLEGSTVTLAYRADHAVKPYAKYFIVDRAPLPATGGEAASSQPQQQCVPVPGNGWLSPAPAPASVSPSGAWAFSVDSKQQQTAGSLGSDWFLPAPAHWYAEGVKYASMSMSSAEETARSLSEEALLCVRRGGEGMKASQCSQIQSALEVWPHYAAETEALEASGESSWGQQLSSALRDRSGCIPFWSLFLFFSSLFLFPRFRSFLSSSKLRLVCFFLLPALWLFLWMPLYQKSLDRWGTFAPWNALIYTRPYYLPPSVSQRKALVQGGRIDLGVDSDHATNPAFAISSQALKLEYPTSAASTVSGEATTIVPLTAAEVYAGPPSPSWRPPSGRVVVSFTLMPHHASLLGDTLLSLLAQTLTPDAIYVNLPLGRNKRTNQTYEILPYLQELVDKHPNLHILRCADVGPLTKLVPTLLAETDPSTYVITVDSDKVYHPATVSTLVWRSYWDPSAAFGLCGWAFHFQPPPMEVVPVYVPWAVRGSKGGREVDVLQACCGNVYRRGFFPDLDLLRKPHPKCFTTDDLWIAAYLATRSHVKRVLISTPGAWSSSFGSLEPSTPSWKASDPAEWQLSSYNGKQGVDMTCIRGAEEWLGPWRIVRQVEGMGRAHQQEPGYIQQE